MGQLLIKKLLFVAFIAVTVAGCKKESSQVVKMNEDLMGGAWTVQSNRMIYYGLTGQAEYEEVFADGSVAAEIHFMKGLKASITTHDNKVLETRYNLVKEDDLIYMELYDAAIFEAHIWRVVKASAKEMTWTVNFTDIKYENEETGEILEAPKATLTLKFSKE